MERSPLSPRSPPLSHRPLLSPRRIEPLSPRDRIDPQEAGIRARPADVAHVAAAWSVVGAPVQTYVGETRGDRQVSDASEAGFGAVKDLPDESDDSVVLPGLRQPDQIEEDAGPVYVAPSIYDDAAARSAAADSSSTDSAGIPMLQDVRISPPLTRVSAHPSVAWGPPGEGKEDDIDLEAQLEAGAAVPEPGAAPAVRAPVRYFSADPAKQTLTHSRDKLMAGLAAAFSVGGREAVMQFVASQVGNLGISTVRALLSAMVVHGGPVVVGALAVPLAGAVVYNSMNSSRRVADTLTGNQLARLAWAALPAVVSFGAAAYVGGRTGSYLMAFDSLNRTVNGYSSSETRDNLSQGVWAGVLPSVKVKDPYTKTQKEIAGTDVRSVAGVSLEYMKTSMGASKTGSGSNGVRPFQGQPGDPRTFLTSAAGELPNAYSAALSAFAGGFSSHAISGIATAAIGTDLELTPGGGLARLRQNLSEMSRNFGAYHAANVRPHNDARRYISGMVSSIMYALVDAAAAGDETTVFVNLRGVLKGLMEFRGTLADKIKAHDQTVKARDTAQTNLDAAIEHHSGHEEVARLREILQIAQARERHQADELEVVADAVGPMADMAQQMESVVQRHPALAADLRLNIHLEDQEHDEVDDNAHALPDPHVPLDNNESYLSSSFAAGQILNLSLRTHPDLYQVKVVSVDHAAGVCHVLAGAPAAGHHAREGTARAISLRELG